MPSIAWTMTSAVMTVVSPSARSIVGPRRYRQLVSKEAPAQLENRLPGDVDRLHSLRGTLIVRPGLWGPKERRLSVPHVTKKSKFASAGYMMLIFRTIENTRGRSSGSESVRCVPPMIRSFGSSGIRVGPPA